MATPNKRLVAQASSHQGNPSFTAPGRQCMFNAIASCAMNEIIPVQNWNMEVLDKILNNGDWLCVNFCVREAFPVVTDLRKHFYLNGNQFQVSVGDSYYGSLAGETDGPFCSIKDALQNVEKYSVLTMGSCTPAYSCGVIKSDGDVFVFDSHSRDQNGMSCSDGKCTLTVHSLETIGLFLVELVDSLDTGNQFELTPVTVTCLPPPAHVSRPNPADAAVNTDALLLCQESDDVDSDYSDDIPLGSIKNIRYQVEHQRQLKSQRIKETSHQSRQQIQTSQRESKARANEFMKELFTSELSPLSESYGHISDSDGGDDETYTPSIPKKHRLSREAVSLEDLSRSSLHVEMDVPVGYTDDASDMDTGNVSLVSTNSSFLDTTFQCPPADSVRGGRRRQRDPENWVFNIAKRKRTSGEEYVTRKGKQIMARKMKQGCGDKCRLKCHDKVTGLQRENIFHGFWQMGCLARQRDFISRNVDEVDRKRVKNQGESRRKRSIKWHFEIHSVRIEVFKKFFLDTLDISDTMVYTALNKTNNAGIVQPDLRGKLSVRPNDRGDEKVIVREHIEGFPRTESHYCRKETKRFYLEGGLSVQKMYNMYKEERLNQHCSPVSESTYKQIFYTEFNLGFFRRSKDRCDFCTSYQNSEDKEDKKEEYDNHHKMKNQAIRLKDIEKERAKNDTEFSAAAFDLEDVLITPKGNAKGFFYKRRLNTYNLSIHDYGSEKGINNVWNERIGKRGSNEIGSCLYKFIVAQIGMGKTMFSFYSDACGGQNRNKHIVAFFWWIRTVYDLKEIRHTFFVSGHSQNEVDGIHSRIEQTCKHLYIFTTSQWAACIRTARQKAPRYDVVELDVNDILNIKEISSQIQNFDINTDREKIQYLKLKQIRMRREEPNIIDMSYGYEDDSWFQLNLEMKGRKHCRVPDAKVIILKPVRDTHIVLDENKLKDLDSLCEKKLIPKVHHAFFKSLH